MRVFFLSLLVSFFSLVFAAEMLGTIEHTQGTVKVKSEDSFKKVKVKSGFEIHKGDMIITSKKASALIKLQDASVIALDESSTIRFSTQDLLEQQEGKVFYKITSRDAKNSLKVKTSFAIIGIKGTTFIVNSTQHPSVILKEGLIGIQSIKKEFELYSKTIKKHFDNYASEQKTAFEKFKQVKEQGVAQMTKMFELQEGNKVSFEKNRVDENSLALEDEAEFAYFEKLIQAAK